MSVFFSIGIAMLFEISREFRQKIWRANFVFVAFILLLLILPGPFTDSFFFGVLRLSVEWYFYLCTFALFVVVYFIFRHKVGINPISDALKSALEVMNDIFITMDEAFNIEMMRGKAVGDVLGYKENELLRKSFISLIVQKDYLTEYRNYVLQKRMKESYFDADLICKNGSQIPMNFSFTPIFINDVLSK
ncbi:MAG: PAS domain S-box protein [Ignavibacteriales bacterium]|nr:PAS domain S-box protein [Ignavibacteriales bacterium]